MNIVSNFGSDLEIRFHAKHQATDNELNGIMFRARHMQHYILEVPVDIIISRNTDSKPCSDEVENFDETRRKIAMKKMTEKAGCVVPYIKRNDSEAKICTNESSAETADSIYKAKGHYFDLYNWRDVPLPCNQIDVQPRNTFELLDWDNKTYISANFMKISKVTEQQASYSFTSFYAEVGGGVGLLLGVSVHQLALILIGATCPCGTVKQT